MALCLLTWIRTPYRTRLDLRPPGDPADPAEALVVQELFTRFIEDHASLFIMAKHLRVLGIASARRPADYAQRRQLVELLIDPVVVTDDEVVIRYVLPLSPKGERGRSCHLRQDYLNGLTPAVKIKAAREPVTGWHLVIVARSCGQGVLRLAGPRCRRPVWQWPLSTARPCAVKV